MLLAQTASTSQPRPIGQSVPEIILDLMMEVRHYAKH